MSLLRFDHVSKSYGDEEVLHDVSFELDAGDVEVIVGPSGSGKSTLLRCVNRLTEIDDGAIYLDGEDVHAMDENSLRRRVGMVFQDFNLFAHRTARGNVTLGLTEVLGLSAAEAILLKWAGMDVFDAVTHTFGTVATGGFSPRNASIAAFDSASIDAIITVFMLLSGVNFVMYYSLIARRFSTVRNNSELKVYIGIVVSAVLMTTLLLARTQYDTIAESLRFASFQVASLLTTTGYVTADYQLWPTAAMAVLFILMFIGGSAGSTAGGVKVVRHTALLKQAFNEMKYLLHPRGVFSPRLNSQPLRKSMVLGVAGFLFLYLLLLLITTLVVTLSGSSLLTGFSAALATLGCIGPAFGGVGPVENYAAFPMGVKVFLTFIMLVGRLEIYTVLILFTPGYWRR